MQRTAIVIGAGVVGLTTCYALANRGWRVTLVEKEAGPCLGASHANGAQLSYCYTDALASPAVLKNIPRTLLGNGGLRMSWSADPAFARWLASFLRNCTEARFKVNTLAGLALARRSRDAMTQLLAKFPIVFGHHVAGKLHLYFSQAEFANAQRISALKRGRACEQQILSADEAVALEPSLDQLTKDLVGAIYTPSEEVGNAYDFCLGLLEVLETSFEFMSIFGRSVTEVDQSGADSVRVCLSNGQTLTADSVVVCAASASQHLVSRAELKLPILPMKGYSFEMPPTDASPKHSITDTKHRIVMANLGDRMRVAGFADLGNWDAKADPDISAKLVSLARQSFPQAGDYNCATNHWAGLRPMTPNSLPIIARPTQALAINAGHGMLGWTLAMGAAERLADLLDRDSA